MEIVSKCVASNKVSEVIQAFEEVPEGSYDLGILFVTKELQDQFQEIVAGVSQHVSIANFMACTCAGVIGTNRELENQAAASLFLAKFPGVTCKPFHLIQSQLEELRSSENYYDYLDVLPDDKPIFFLVPDPFQIDLNTFLEQMNEAYPGAQMVGGLSSASTVANGNKLYLNGETYTQGMVGVSLSGNIKVDTIVSQGCKPIGEPYIITKAENNIIYEVAGKTFLDILRQVFLKLNEEDRELLQQALLVGVAIDEYTHKFGRGDFLVRPVLGIDQEIGAVGIGDRIKSGQTIQLHLRDAQTASEDLKELLRGYATNNKSTRAGALLFSCNGRGEGLFGEANHDIKMIQDFLGPIPAAGFFCAGEIGPIGGRNFVHGFTDSIVVFSASD